jgi:hypothetical protein
VQSIGAILEPLKLGAAGACLKTLRQLHLLRENYFTVSRHFVETLARSLLRIDEVFEASGRQKDIWRTVVG